MAAKGLFWLWIVLITILSLMPVEVGSVEIFPHQDKLGHFIFYSGMAWLLGRTGYIRYPHLMLKLICMTSFYGMLMEILQAVMRNGRHFDTFDIIANIIGAMMGAGLILLWSLKSS